MDDFILYIFDIIVCVILIVILCYVGYVAP